MGEKSALSVDLSHVLLAFTIEVDNVFEQRLRDAVARPFLASLVMWSNVMRYITDDGITVGNLAQANCQPHKPVASLVGGLERWGYLTVDHDPNDGSVERRAGFGSARGVKPQTVLRPSTTGAVAQKLWEPLVGEVEDRWVRRFGSQNVEQLRGALAAIHDQLDVAMPRYLPVLSAKGLFASPVVALREGSGCSEHELPALISRVLLAYTMDYERGTAVSLPVAANVLRVLGPEPMPMGSVPLAAGVSREAVSMSLTWLHREGYARVTPAPSGRGKAVSLTVTGTAAQTLHSRRLIEVDTGWERRFGSGAVTSLELTLSKLLGDRSLPAGLEPPAGGWRGHGRYKDLTAAFVSHPRIALPQSPVVLHRGGWPDGS